MPLDVAEKAEIVETYGTHEGDTGSPEVQIAIFDRRIKQLQQPSFSFSRESLVSLVLRLTPRMILLIQRP